MKKNFRVISILLFTFMLLLACSIGPYGQEWNFGGDEPDGPIDPGIEDLLSSYPTKTGGGSGSDATPEPEYQPADYQGSGDLNPETANAGTHEYSVEATNFDCTCQASGNITPIIKFSGDKVEFLNADGSGLVYDKIGENTFKRTYMGYYILQNGSGAQATQTKVDEERRDVLIFNGSGYRFEFYQGTSETPCCYYTNTIVK